MKREISRSQEMNRISIPANIPFEGINMGFDYQTDAYGNPLTGDMLTRMVDMMGDQLMTPSSENAEISHNAVSETLPSFVSYSMYDVLEYSSSVKDYASYSEDPFELEETFSKTKRSSKLETAPAIYSMREMITRHFEEQMQRELLEELTDGALSEADRFVEIYEDTARMGDMTFWRINSRICMAYVKLSITVCENNAGRERLSERYYSAELLFDMTSDVVETSITYYPYCLGFDQPMIQSAWKLDDYLVPILSKEEIEKAAWELHCRYFPESRSKSKFTRTDFDAFELARRMGLQVKTLPLHKMSKTKSLLFFCERPIKIDVVESGIEGKTEWLRIPENCIVINSHAVHKDDCQMEVFHECFHYDMHYLFYRLQDMSYNDLTTIKRVPVTNSQQLQAKRSVAYMEYQARRGSFGLMMPKPFLQPLTAKLIKQYAPISRHAGELYESIIYAIRKEYRFAQFRIRARLIQLGHIEAKGAMNYVDNRRIPAFAFAPKNMDAGSSYVIDHKELIKEYRTNARLRQLIHEGSYVYADGHVCRNLPEWINQWAEIPRLTLCAEKHVDQCCLRFRSIYELNELSEYEYGRLACDEEYNKHYLNYLDCDHVSPFAAHKKVIEFLHKLPDGFFPALDFIRNEKQISLEKLEELSHISRKKLDRERKKVKWSLTRDEVIALCVALKMPPWLSKEMLKRAHIALDERDSIDQTYLMILDLFYMDSIFAIQKCLRENGCEELVLSCG